MTFLLIFPLQDQSTSHNNYRGSDIVKENVALSIWKRCIASMGVQTMMILVRQPILTHYDQVEV